MPNEGLQKRKHKLSEIRLTKVFNNADIKCQEYAKRMSLKTRT